MKQTRARKTPARRGHILIDRDICKGCSLCVSVCPRSLIVISGRLNEKGYYPAEFLEGTEAAAGRTCNACCSCAIICPDVAIEVYRD